MPDPFITPLKSWPPYTPQGPDLAAGMKGAKNRYDEEMEG